MITTPLLENSMNLVIPSSGATTPPITSSQVQTISIDRTETIRFNNQIVDRETLGAQLLEMKRRNPDVAVVIRPDRELPVQKLVSLAGRIATCANHQGGDRHESGNEIDDVERRPLLAKRHSDSTRAYCPSGGVDPLESARQEPVKCTKKCTKHRLDWQRRKWCGRNQERRTVADKSFSCSAEPTPLKTDEPEDERPLLTAAKSEIQLPRPKPAATSTPTPKPTASPTPKAKATPKLTPKPTPKKTVLAKASPKPSPKVKPTPAKSGEKQSKPI